MDFSAEMLGPMCGYCTNIIFLQILTMMWLKALFVVLILIWSFFINIFWYLLAEFCLTRPPIRQNVSKRLDGQSRATVEFCLSFYLNHIGFGVFKIVSKLFCFKSNSINCLMQNKLMIQMN